MRRHGRYDDELYQPPLRHSGYGLTSCILAGAFYGPALVGLAIVFSIGTNRHLSESERNSAGFSVGYAASMCACASPFVAILGVVFGIAGCAQPRRRKLLAVAGTAANSLALFIALLLIAISLASAK